MSGTWRDRAREQVGAEVEARFQELLRDEPLTSDELETAMRVNRLTAMQAVEPDARLDEEITIRLISEQIRTGLLMPGTADPILRNLQKAISASADEDIQLGIVGISSGSTVLHVCPVYPHGQTGDEPEPDDDQDDDLPGIPVAVPAAESSLDAAMHQLLELFDAAQNDEPLYAEPEMLEAFEGLVRTLDKSAIDVDFGWHAGTGTVRTGRLTAEGRQYAQRRMQPQIKRSLRTMRGYVSELSAPSGKGRIRLRTSTAGRSGPKIDITTDELIGLGLAFGEWVAVEVTVEERIDPLSRRSTTEYTYHALIERRR